jgi:phosphomannomutase
MIPWLLVLSLMSEKNIKLSELVEERENLFPVSGEINVKLENPDEKIKEIEEKYSKYAISIDYTDGISMEFENWRFNLRKSNTEPLVRLNAESRADKELMKEKTDEILGIFNCN